VGHIINEKLAEIAVRRDQVIDSVHRHHPQPLNIQPLNMIIPENVEPNSEKASETTPEAAASEKVVSESPHQQTPEPHKPTSPPQPQSPLVDIDPQLNIQTQTSPQQPPQSNPQPEHTEPQPEPQPEESLPQHIPMDIDNHQVNLQASTSTSHVAPDQPSSSTQAEQLTIPKSNHVQDFSLSDSDQPSDLEILEQPPLNILESDYIDTELLKILSEMHNLIEHIWKIDLSSAYEKQWESLQKKATDLIASVSRKCIRIKTTTVRKFMKDMELAKKSPRLLLKNKSFYSEADYMTR
jgi:hypothetical protein